MGGWGTLPTMLSQVGTADLPRAPIKKSGYLVLMVFPFVNYAVHCTLVLWLLVITPFICPGFFLHNDVHLIPRLHPHTDHHQSGQQYRILMKGLRSLRLYMEHLV